MGVKVEHHAFENQYCMKVREQLHVPAASPPGKSHQYALHKLGVCQSWFGCCGGERNLSTPPSQYTDRVISVPVIMQ